MRKLVIIGSSLLIIWLVAMPALVGLYLRDTVAEWLAEHGESASATYQPGWLGSHLLAMNAEADTRLELTARHFPPLKPGWIALRGRLDSPLVPQGAVFRAHLGLTGSWHISGEAELLKSNEQSDLSAGGLIVNVAQVAGQPINLTLRADKVHLPGQSEPLLDLRGRGLRRENENGRIRLGLELQALDPDLGAVLLTIQVGPMTPEQLEFMIGGLRQLAQSQPGSVTEGVALMTIASTWQQMASDGATVELERLQFGEATVFQGRWVLAEPSPIITGSGDIDTLNQWLNRLAPNPQQRAGQTAGNALGLLSELGDVRVDNGTFHFTHRALASPSLSRPNPQQAP